MGQNAEPARRFGAPAPPGPGTDNSPLAVGVDVLHHYRSEVLDALEAHGVRPTPGTPPQLVHEFVSDLYRFELRRLRARQVRGEIPRREYSRHVVALRKRYLLVSLPLRHWTREARESAS